MELNVEEPGLTRFIGLLGEVEVEARRFSGNLIGLTVVLCLLGGGAAAGPSMSHCIGWPYRPPFDTGSLDGNAGVDVGFGGAVFLLNVSSILAVWSWWHVVPPTLQVIGTILPVVLLLTVFTRQRYQVNQLGNHCNDLR